MWRFYTAKTVCVHCKKKKIENINKKIIINSQKLNHDLEKIKFFMYVCIIYIQELAAPCILLSCLLDITVDVSTHQ